MTAIAQTLLRPLSVALVPRARRSHRGLTLLEVLLAIGVAALIAAGAAYSINERAADLKAKAGADQLSMVAQAAETYIKNNMLTVSGMVPNGGDKALIPVSDLVASGYLPAGPFATTPYFASYEIWVRGTGNGGFQAMVAVVGGDDPGSTRLPAMALQTRSNTGFVIHDPYPNADEDRILGAFGGWTASVSDFRPGASSGDDVWLASLLAIQDDIAGNDFLYRGAIPGRPDLNEMRTDITMTLDSGIVWRDPRTGAEMDLRLATDNTANKTTLILDGDTPTTEFTFQNPAGNGGITIEVKDDSNPGEPNEGGTSITINSTLAANTAAAAAAGYGPNDPYNLYVDGKTNITGDTRIGGNLDVDGDVNLGDDAADQINVTGIFNVTGPTTIDGTLEVTQNAFFRQDVRIDGDLDLRGCLAIGGAPDAAGYCLNVGNGGRTRAARFYDDVRIDGALNTSGDITAENANMRALAYFYQSDARYKENITPLDNALDRLLEIEGVAYNWRVDGRRDLGVIAQDVEETFPELVHTDTDGYKSVEYGNFIAPIIEGLRELKNENDTLKAQVEQLSKNGSASPTSSQRP